MSLKDLMQSRRESKAIVYELWQRHEQFRQEAGLRKATVADAQSFCAQMADALEDTWYLPFGAEKPIVTHRIKAHAAISADKDCSRRANLVLNFWNRSTEEIHVDLNHIYDQAAEMRERFFQADATSNFSPTLA